MPSSRAHPSWFGGPGFGDLRSNAVAGVIVGIIAIPLSIALAVAVGVAPIVGLYTAMVAGAVAAITGGSRFNITGPTAALVPLLAPTVVQHGAASLPLIALMAGVILLGMSAVGAGRLIRFMPRLVILGFTAGIALSIAFGQLNALLGISGTDPSLEHFHEKFADSLRHLGTVSLATPLVGMAVVVMLIGWERTPWRRVPATLVGLTAVTAVTWALAVDTPTLASRYGELPRRLPLPDAGFLDTGLVVDLLPIAVAVAILGAVESLLSATVADGMSGRRERHDPDRELRGQGLANLAVSFTGGMPATAAIARTGAGIANGATSRLTGVFHALTVLVITLALGGVAGHIPMAALAGVLVVVAWKIADVEEVLAMFRRAPRADVVVLAATMLITLAFDLTYAIGFGVVVSMVLLLRQLISVPAAREMLPDAAGRVQSVSSELSALIQSRPDIDFFTAQGVLSFHSAAQFEYQLSEGRARPLILRMKDVHYIDSSGLITLEGIIKHHQGRNGRIMLTALQPNVRSLLERFGIIELLGSENVFEHTRCAIESIEHDAALAKEGRPAGGMDVGRETVQSATSA